MEGEKRVIKGVLAKLQNKKKPFSISIFEQTTDVEITSDGQIYRGRPASGGEVAVDRATLDILFYSNALMFTGTCVIAPQPKI